MKLKTLSFQPTIALATTRNLPYVLLIVGILGVLCRFLEMWTMMNIEHARLTDKNSEGLLQQGPRERVRKTKLGLEHPSQIT